MHGEVVVKLVMISWGQQVLEVQWDQFRLVQRARQLSHNMLNLESEFHCLLLQIGLLARLLLSKRTDE